MNTLRWIVHLVATIVLICIGVVFGVLALSARASNYAHGVVWKQEARLEGYWTPDRRMAGGASLALLSLGVLSAVTLPRCGRRGDVLSYSQDGSEVRIARRAVEDFISKLGKEVDGVSDMSSWVVSRNDMIQVNVHISVDVGRVAIPQACSAVKSIISREMRDTLGFPNVGEVNVQVSRLGQTGPRKGAKTGEALPSAEESYTFQPPPET